MKLTIDLYTRTYGNLSVRVIELNCGEVTEIVTEYLKKEYIRDNEEFDDFNITGIGDI